MSMPHPGAALKIVVADDDDLLSAVVASALESHGYDVWCAPGGLVSSSAAFDADLVILDANVPTQDFNLTLEQLRTQSIAVLVCSGELTPPRGVEPSSYLAKPVDLELLLSAVARMAPAGLGR